MEKLPPVEKVYEAWTALADRSLRFESGGACRAVVGRIEGVSVTWDDGVDIAPTTTRRLAG